MNTQDWVIAFKKGNATWGDGAGLSFAANHGLRFMSWAFPVGFPTREFDEAIGDEAPIDSGHDSFVDINGALGDMYARYEGLERILAFAIGACSTSTVLTKGKHEMTLPLASYAAWGALAVQRGVGNVMLYPSVKLTGGEFKYANGFLVFTPNGIANVLDVTTNPSLASATQPSTALIIPVRDAVFRIKEVTGAEGALGGGDVVRLIDIAPKWDNKMVGDHTTSEPTGGVAEPDMDGGLVEATLRIQGAKHDATWQAFLDGCYALSVAGTKKYKADLVFTGPANGAATRKLTFEWPALVATAVELPGDGPRSRVRPAVEFRAAKASAAPAGMTVTAPMKITIDGSNLLTSPLV